MTLVRTRATLPGLDNPVYTSAKRIARWQASVDWNRIKKEQNKVRVTVVPPVDAAALSRKYGMEAASAPQRVEGTFRVPLGISPPLYERTRNEAVRRFIETMDRMGWDFVPEGRIQVSLGMYPAVDLRDAVPLLDQREMRIRALFRFRKPKPVRIELPREYLEPQVLRG